MTTALQAAEKHLADLAANRVPARDKPSALHHGLITQLVAELRIWRNSVQATSQEVYLAEQLRQAQAKIDHLRTLALDWYHGEDCDGYGTDDEPEWPECNCGVGDIIRGTSPAGIEVYIDRTTERYGLSRILEPTVAR